MTAFENILQPFHRRGSWDSVSPSGLLRLPGHQVTELGFKSVFALPRDGFPPLSCCLWFFPVPWTSCTRVPTRSWSPCVADLCSCSGNDAGLVGPRDAHGRRWALRVPTLPDPVIPWLLFPTFLLWKEPGAPNSLCRIPTLNTEDEVVGWHHQPNGHESEQTDLWLHREEGVYSSHGTGEVQPQIRPGRVLRRMIFHMPMRLEKSFPMASLSSM